MFTIPFYPAENRRRPASDRSYKPLTNKEVIMSQECNCDTPKVSIPLRGIELSFDADAFGNGGSSDGFIPDLRVGVETKWPMRYMGKQVYARLVDCGAMPNSTTRTIAHNIPDIDWVQVSWDSSSIYSSATNSYFYGPVYHSTNATNASAFRVLCTKTNIDIRSSYNISDHHSVLCVLYTKTTDEALP